ncbi:MAG: glycoside-pentoside-hexuronide (GPH):cation symporter [Clostridia bacterium]|nr:glycoside-pentoside-hexuronide (GPH):cation symporter [Clostridia bacterium]
MRPFGKRDLFGYAMGDFGCNMCFALITNYMMLYYIQYIGLKTTDWAWIIIVGKIWDAINDPIIGSLVDNVKIGKSGKFMPWISMGSVALIVTTTLTFLPIRNAGYTFKVIFCLVTYCLWSVAYTMANVPYGALHSCITEDPAQRTNLSTFRSIGAGLAQAPLMLLLPIILYDKNDNLLGNRMVYVALICTAVGFFGFLLVRVLVTERVHIEKEERKFNYAATVKAFFTNRPLIAATIVTFVQIICFMSMTSVNNIIFQTYFKNARLVSIVNIVAYVPLVALMPFIGKITRRIGKRGISVYSAAVGVITGIVAVFLPMKPENPSAVPVWMVCLMLVDVSNSVLSILIWAMVVDCIDYSYKKTGVKEEGSVYALYSFFRKLAQGAGSAICALALSACGYVESLGAQQSMQTALNIKNMYIYFMLAGSVVTAAVMKFMYNIKE